MPKISDRRARARRRGIVAAAARCLQRNGLGATGMRDLFRAANLSPGAVYSYFPGKEALLAAVAAAGPSPVEALLEATRAVDDPKERLAALLEEAAAGHPPTRLQCELEAAALGSPAIAAGLDERRRATRAALAAALGGEPPDAGARELAELALAVCEGLARRRLLEPEADLGGMVAAATRLLGGALAGAP